MNAFRALNQSVSVAKHGLFRLSAATRQCSSKAAPANPQEGMQRVQAAASELVAATKAFIPQSMGVVKQEAGVYMSNPLNWTVGQTIAGGAVALELFAFFVIGEVFGRGQLIGYPVKPHTVHKAH
eukprot:CAMPEP_0206230616 /NCGR_PEP_ID=MMETSP0047_2-20121206/10366_1 /ASSEMBLY_ACC=CAM_ASM_000192 /TAXON_ID=195065 /ORGANISM="Chroomonas mesostigmatica_cf, Strain CCMP1168" /LENGTH=124 /DNA_ID=CAMNT_0053654075 /DNA_START=15 /DNA_END=389 /DNA_ORIENTATION=-